MKIALANPDLVWPRGAQRQALMLAREWQKLGHEVAFYTGERATPYAFDDLLQGLRIEVGEPWYKPLARGNTLPGSGALRFLATRATLARTARAIDAGKHDVLNAHNHPAQWIAALGRTPVVWTCNEPPFWHYYPEKSGKLNDPWGQWQDKRAAAKIRRITVLDDRIGAIVRRAYPGIPVDRTGSGCELPGPLPARGGPAPKGFDPVDGGFQMLSVLGALNHQKRPLDVVRAAGAIGGTLHLVGADAEGAIAAARADAARSGLRLRHHPKLSEAELLYLYANADLALFLPENQPWGIFPLEALLAGIPAIVSHETGALEVLPKDYDLVAKVGDTAGAAALARRVKEDPASARATVAAAASVIRSDYSWAACAKRVLGSLQAAVRHEGVS